MQLLKHGYIICFFILCSVNEIGAQNYIGMHKDQLSAEMKKSYPAFKLNTSFVNPYYKYLKYEDKINEITILFFLSENDVCTLVRKMCDYSNINDEIENLDKKFKAAGKNKWTYTHEGNNYLVTLEEGDWFYTVTTKKTN